MNGTHRIRMMSLALVLALAGAGCGSDGGSGSEADPSANPDAGSPGDGDSGDGDSGDGDSGDGDGDSSDGGSGDGDSGDGGIDDGGIDDGGVDDGGVDDRDCTAPCVTDDVSTPDSVVAGLSEDETILGNTVRVTLPDSMGEPVTILIEVPSTPTMDGIRVVYVDENGQPIDVDRANIAVAGDSVRVVVTESGTYTVVEQILPPAGCSPHALQATLNLQDDAALDTALTDGKTLADVTRLQGGLTIGGTVSSLAKLKCLTWVDGPITVQNASALEAVDLPGLAKVQGAITVQNAPKLTAVRLPRLRTVGSGNYNNSIVFNNLTELTVIDIRSLGEAPGHLSFTNLAATADEALTMDFGALAVVRGGFDLNGVSTLTTVDGFQKLAEVQGNIDIRSSGDLEDLDGLGSLMRVGGYIHVNSNGSLKTADLAALQSVGNYVHFQYCAKLTTVHLPALDSVSNNNYGNSFVFDNLTELTSIDVSAIGEAPGHLSFTTLSATADEPLTLDFGSLTIIRGGLDLNTVATLENVDGFGMLNKVLGNIDIRSNGDIADLGGLSALEEVGGYLHVNSNGSLRTATLPALTSVGNYVHFQYCAKLTTVGLPALDSVSNNNYGNSFVFNNLTELTAIDVSAIGEAPGHLSFTTLSATADEPLTIDFGSLKIVRGGLDLNSVATLENVDGFGALKEVLGNVDIRSNGDIENLDGFGALEKVGGYLHVNSNGALQSATLPALTSVANYVQFQYCPKLTTVAMRLLDSVGANNYGNSFVFNNLSELTSIDISAIGEAPGHLSFTTLAATADAPLSLDFGSLTIVRGGLDLNDVTSLTGLSGFAQLTEVVGNVDIRSDRDLVSLAGLSALRDVGGYLHINGNAGLQTASLPALQSVGNYVQFQYCDKLTSIALPLLDAVGNNNYSNSFVFNNLTAIGSIQVSSIGETPGHLYFADLAGTGSGPLAIDFGALNIVRGGVSFIRVSRSAALTSFPLLGQIDGNLAVQGCADLTALTGLSPLTSLGGSLSITSNPMLDNCLALSFRDTVKPVGTGSSTIASNGTNPTCTGP